MARPKKEGMDYFPHDTDAVNDEKIEALRFLYGNDGYAFYFILLERIYRSKNSELDVSDAETIQILSRKVEVTEEKFVKMMSTCLKKHIFDEEEYANRRVLTSEGIKKRASVVVSKRVSMREKYHNSKVEEVSEAETNQKQGKNASESTQSKVKKSKEKKSKEKESKELIPYAAIVNRLNEKVGKNFNHQAKKTRELIHARFEEGYTEDDFYKVIDNKVRSWLHSPKFKQYLKPDTLFTGKFDKYLNEDGTEHGQAGSDLSKYNFEKEYEYPGTS